MGLVAERFLHCFLGVLRDTLRELIYFEGLHSDDVVVTHFIYELSLVTHFCTVREKKEHVEKWNAVENSACVCSECARPVVEDLYSTVQAGTV